MAGAEQAADFLGMSDEDFLKSAVPDEPEAEADDDDEGTDATADQEPTGDQSESDDAADDEDDSDADAGDSADTTGDSGDDSGDADSGADNGAAAPDTTGEAKPEEPVAGHDDFFNKITAPFQANGKQMQVDNPDDVIRLMQMGANYNRKMAAMKPHLKMLKTLENAGLLTEEKLNYLIDLDKKNPAAIAKLIQDSKVDPMDLDLTQGENYKAARHQADDREVELDEVIGEIKDSPSYAKTIKIVSGDWDAKSKQIVADNPQLLKLINTQVANGVYDLISTEVERERVFGRLDGMSSIEAYRQVGDAIEARGGFAHLSSSQGQGQQTTSESSQVDTTVADAARKDKRKAAGPSKAASPKAAATEDYNPLGMSDEEYLKLHDPRLL